jgi:hypothetical protein
MLTHQRDQIAEIGSAAAFLANCAIRVWPVKMIVGELRIGRRELIRHGLHAASNPIIPANAS